MANLITLRNSALGNNGQSAASTTIVFTVPANAQTGDLSICCVDLNSAVATFSGVPAGYVLLRGLDVAAATFECALYYKFLPGVPGSTSTDAGGTATFTSSSVKCIGIMVVLALPDGLPFDVNALATSGSTNTVITAPSVTTVHQNDFILEFFVGHTATVVNVAGTLSGALTSIGYSSTNFAAAANLSMQAAYITNAAAVPGSFGGQTATYVTTNPQQLSYTIGITPQLAGLPQNYQQMKVPDGMSTSEKIK